jgi:Protein of unknown function (DUF2950)
MQRIGFDLGIFRLRGFSTLAAVVILAACFPGRSMAQQQNQKTFPSAEDAGKALYTAEQNNDEKTMLDILGPDGKRLVSSGDDIADANDRAMFVQKYEQVHRLVKEPDGSTTLYIGAENWPMPLPLMQKGGSWYFDTDAGRREILYRRIGRNELATIQICQQLVAAQKEYYGLQHNEYAEKLFSDKGQRNGLYWKAGEGETPSPIGPLVAAAVAKGYDAQNASDSTVAPYMGYYYRILTRQGPNAQGGAKSYVTDGKMTDGFAFIAYPAEYRSSGVMTFMVGVDGVVYQKDLGKQTAAAAESMRSYNPTTLWQKVEDQQEESAADQPAK